MRPGELKLSEAWWEMFSAAKTGPKIEHEQDHDGNVRSFPNSPLSRSLLCDVTKIKYREKKDWELVWGNGCCAQGAMGLERRSAHQPLRASFFAATHIKTTEYGARSVYSIGLPFDANTSV